MVRFAIAWCLVLGASPFSVWADQRARSAEAARLAAKGQAPLTAEEEEQLVTRGWRNRRAGEYDPPVSTLSRPADYVSPTKRGALEWNARWRNYAWHAVRVPDGTTIDCRDGGNYTQLVPNTDVFDRSTGFGHNLTLIECNLTNVKTYPDWTIQSCNTAQVWMKGTLDPDGNPQAQDTELVAPRSSDVPLVLVPPSEALQ